MAISNFFSNMNLQHILSLLQWKIFTVQLFQTYNINEKKISVDKNVVDNSEIYSQNLVNHLFQSDIQALFEMRYFEMTTAFLR